MVNIFAETFQSFFKNDLNRTVDYRMIPSAIILISVIFTIILPLVNDSLFSIGPNAYATTM